MNRVRPDAVVMARVFQALMLKALSTEEIAAVGGWHQKTANRHAHALYNATPKVIHVGAWALDARGFYTIRCYRWGNLTDVKRPKQITTSTERVRKLRAARKLQQAVT